MATDSSPFATPVTIVGPERAPHQMLAEQTYDGHVSVHDGEMADKLGLAGAPIEGPTHFSQIDPLAALAFGDRWFTSGCVSAHFQTMVVEGERVTASLTTIETTTGASPSGATIEAHKTDGTPVLTGTATVDPTLPTELRQRLAAAQQKSPGELFIVDRLHVGDTVNEAVRAITMDESNGEFYPFSLADKLERITEPSPWYSSGDNPWGRPIIPFEMISVLANKGGIDLPVRGPAVGLFIDLEVRLDDGPLFVDEPYRIEREVLAVAQSRRVESHWVESRIFTGDERRVATMLLHSGVFKASYADYPADRLA